MDTLTKHLTSLKFKNRSYTVDLAYPLVLKYFKAIKDTHLTTREQLHTALYLFVGKQADDLSIDDQTQLLVAIYKTYIFTDEDRRLAEFVKHEPKAFDNEQDQALIYSAFLQQYGIDLSDPDIRMQLSWSQYNALLDGLGEDTYFRRITSIRTMKIPDDASDEYKDYIKRMKTMYALVTHDGSGKLTKDEVKAILAPLDMPHKMLKLKELREKHRI